MTPHKWNVVWGERSGPFDSLQDLNPQWVCVRCGFQIPAEIGYAPAHEYVKPLRVGNWRVNEDCMVEVALQVLNA